MMLRAMFVGESPASFNLALPRRVCFLLKPWVVWNRYVFLCACYLFRGAEGVP